LDLSVQALSFVPNIFFRISDFFDIRLGLYGDMLLSTNVKHVKELVTHSTVLPNGERVIVTLAEMSGNEATLEDREIPEPRLAVEVQQEESAGSRHEHPAEYDERGGHAAKLAK